MDLRASLFDYTIRLADNALILGQRLGEWCGHGPVLEQDIAMTNIALDFVGQARLLYQYAATLEQKGRSEDDLAFLRDSWDFRNVLLVEQPNTDFAYTVVRQFLYDSFDYFFYEALQASNDTNLAAIAEKSLKEIRYHLRWSAEWVIRLGDGTDISRQKMQQAVDDLWPYAGELLTMNETDRVMVDFGIGVDLNAIAPAVEQRRKSVMAEATLRIPDAVFMQQGGKNGLHTEHLGYILAEMQYLQRTYPGANW